MNFIAIDFETATNYYASACSLGMVFVQGNQIIDEKYYLINPPENKVDIANTNVHGLSANDLINAPQFNEVWSNVQESFNEDFFIVAHNAVFDMNVLKNSLLHYDLEVPNFKYFCSIPFSTRACVSANVGRSLEDRTTYFGIELEQAHNSLHDARAVAEMLIRCLEINNTDTVSSYLSAFNVPVNQFAEFKHTDTFLKRGTSKFAGKKLNNITTDVEWFDAAHPFFAKQIVFTGDMASINRKSAAQAAKDLGAILKNGVSRSTNYLVVGVQDPKLVGKKGVSTKEIRAAELIKQGYKIQILNEDQFLELLDYEVPEAEQQPISKAEILEKERIEKEEKERQKREREMWWL